MSGITKKVRGLNQYLAEEEENKLEKLAESIPGFETREKAEKEQQYRIKAITKAVLQMVDGNRKLPPEVKETLKALRKVRRKLKSCTADSLCGSAACPQCFRLHRLRKLAELEGLRKKKQTYRVVTLIYYDAMLEQDELLAWNYSRFKERVRKMIRRAGFVGKIVGGFELDFHVDTQRWMPHLHLLVPNEKPPLKALRRAITRDKNMRTRPGIVSRPVLVQELENFDKQVTYCFKGMWQELRSYKDVEGDRRTRKHRLSPVLLAQALCKQDEIGFTGLTFTAGVRKRRK
ncbi:hypothetical protein [Aeromonas caviae]|uniref:Replication protein n=1 Tax=Aeromonas caviae TaxID=648 RepID=A0AA37CZA1_AERCA|nr:hypothetical protein [Aeromonas caviae]MBL0588048.1 hypothetical protein [Aeromonas caviae]GJA17015.1 hypothetical protein KAM336_00360 [Aeromonas caviae]GJA25943.1 hypothetical protein KAM340_01100 [Aeromonas caviae]GJA63993.1 hypothetical protein KAM351_26040 [Aeromonas caviae]GJA70708.1 hypothetical protein KAM353_03550 [Aeromonas caviae]